MDFNVRSDVMLTADQILTLSKSQKRSCMYSKEELETFSPGKLTAIYVGIAELSLRKPWRQTRKRKGSKSIQRWHENIKIKEVV